VSFVIPWRIPPKSGVLLMLTKPQIDCSDNNPHSNYKHYSSYAHLISFRKKSHDFFRSFVMLFICYTVWEYLTPPIDVALPPEGDRAMTKRYLELHRVFQILYPQCSMHQSTNPMSH